MINFIKHLWNEYQAVCSLIANGSRHDEIQVVLPPPVPQAYSWSKDYTLQDLKEFLESEEYTPAGYTELFRHVCPRGFHLVLIDGEYKAVPPEENPYWKAELAERERIRKIDEAYVEWVRKGRERWEHVA